MKEIVRESRKNSQDGGGGEGQFGLPVAGWEVRSAGGLFS